MRQLVLGVIVATITLFSGAAGAAADEIINIPIDTVITRQGTREGDVRVLASAPVPPELVGATCTVLSEADNQTSVHPNNDVIVSSGSDQVVIPGVEDEPGQISIASGTLTLGTEITAAVRIGPDRQFSGGIIVQLDCDTPDAGQEPTTTVPPTTVPPTEPEVTVQNTVPVETTTTSVPPEQTTASTTPSTEAPQQTTASTTPPDDSDPQELPRTGGSTTTTLTIVALVMLGGGGALVLVTRRSPQRSGWVD
ncbi:MAG: LPXTG cell wall anchor domain-containing protein [Actinomycetota bacterium]